MRRIVGIFAHPDDEALGPSGTLLQFSKTHEVYIICVTNGNAQESGRAARKRLAQIRKRELLASAKVIGVKKVYFLGFTDGTLSNCRYHKIAAKIQRILERLKPETLVTFEPRGVSGHIDHIMVSFVTTYVFQKLPFVKTLMYYCISKNHRQLQKDYFIYFPPGYERSDIGQIIDVSDVWEKKIEVMRAHASQQKDVERVLGNLLKLPKKEYFLLMKR